MRTVNHVLLTRFNLPSAGVQSLIRAQEGWLRERIDLFERYCLPSVTSQSNKNFDWIVYFDPASPQWLKDRVSLIAETEVLTPLFRESVSTAEMISDIRDVIGGEQEDLLTTNLDNDDAVASDFIARIQSTPTPPVASAIYISKGLVRNAHNLYLYEYPRNAFNSVRFPWGTKEVTCWSEWHTEFDNLMPVVEVGGPPGWMQVVHGSNVSNRVRGRLVSSRRYRSEFDSLLDGVAEPRTIDFAKDALVSRPTRFAREFSRAAAKRIIVATLGREGLDKAKVVLRSRAGLG